MIIAIDFDGTLADETNFPVIGPARTQVVEWAKQQKQLGHKLILWTCREGQCLFEAVKWCHEQGIHLDAVNENLPENKYMYLGKAKILADVYVDDRAGNITEILKLKNCELFKKG